MTTHFCPYLLCRSRMICRFFITLGSRAHLGQRGVRWPLFDLDSRLDWVLKRSDHLAKYTRFERAEFAELCSRLGIDIDSREKHHFKYCPVHRCVLLNVFFGFDNILIFFFRFLVCLSSGCSLIMMISLSRLSRNCSLWEMERQTQLSGQRVEDDFFRCVDLIIDVLDADNSGMFHLSHIICFDY